MAELSSKEYEIVVQRTIYNNDLNPKLKERKAAMYVDIGQF
jgi:hypothetical protein